MIKRHNPKVVMEQIVPALSSEIPTVDLSPFMEGGDVSGQQAVIDTISQAMTNLGIFQIENYGISLDQCEKLLDLTKAFFSYPYEVKQKATAKDMEMSGAGYAQRPIDKYHDFEYILMYAPKTPFNGVPTIQPSYWETHKEVFEYFQKISHILQEIINDYLGLPPNFLNTYNNDRSWDFLMPMHYTPLNENGNTGIAEHEDPNMITIILQGDVCGLEVFKDGEWIPIIPTKGKLIVIVSDIVQVLSNKKLRNVTHRAMKNEETHRLAIDFCYHFSPDKWVEPLHKVTGEIGDSPKYKRFKYQDYIDLIMHDYANPPPTVEDFTDLKYFEL